MVSHSTLPSDPLIVCSSTTGVSRRMLGMTTWTGGPGDGSGGTAPGSKIGAPVGGGGASGRRGGRGGRQDGLGQSGVVFGAALRRIWRRGKWGGKGRRARPREGQPVGRRPARRPCGGLGRAQDRRRGQAGTPEGYEAGHYQHVADDQHP